MRVLVITIAFYLGVSLATHLFTRRMTAHHPLAARIGQAFGWPLSALQLSIAAILATVLRVGAAYGFFSPAAIATWERWFIKTLEPVEHVDFDVPWEDCAREIVTLFKETMGTDVAMRVVPLGHVTVYRLHWHQAGVDLRPWAMGFVSGWGTNHVKHLTDAAGIIADAEVVRRTAKGIRNEFLGKVDGPEKP